MRSKSNAAGILTATTLSAEDRAFLDFIARLAVEQTLRERNSAGSAATCPAVEVREESKDQDA